MFEVKLLSQNMLKAKVFMLVKVLVRYGDENVSYMSVVIYSLRIKLALLKMVLVLIADDVHQKI